MKYLNLILFMLTIIFSINTNAIASSNFKNQESKILEPVIKINFKTYGEDGNIHIKTSATGFSVSYDKTKNITYILTNAHFCDARKQFKIPGSFDFESHNSTMSKNLHFSAGNLKLLTYDSNVDLCLLTYEGYIKPVKVAKKDYQLDKIEPVKIVGASVSVFPIITDTYITNKYTRDISPDIKQDGPLLLLTSAIAYSGQSGSPIFNKKSEVVGLIFMSLSFQFQPIYGGIGLSHHDIRMYLDNQNINY